MADLPVGVLTDEAPAYNRPKKRARGLPATDPLETLPQEEDLGAGLLEMLRHPNQADKKPIWRQYDYMVRTNTLAPPGGDAAVIRIKGTKKAVALSTDGNARYCMLDAQLGGSHAVAEAARNVSCTGATPIAMTNCLNFGNPERPAVMSQFALAVEGMAAACRALEVPVVSGNVSFYNETHGIAIYPTPVVGMVGLLDDARKRVGAGFQRIGDAVLLLHPAGESPLPENGAHEYVYIRTGREGGVPPPLDLRAEAAAQGVIREAIAKGYVRSAHDLSDGGLGLALAESCLQAGGRLGAEVRLPEGPGRPDGRLFGETASRILVSTPPESARFLRDLAESRGIGSTELGHVAENRLLVEDDDGTLLVGLDWNALHDAWHGTLAELL